MPQQQDDLRLFPDFWEAKLIKSETRRAEVGFVEQLIWIAEQKEQES